MRFLAVYQNVVIDPVEKLLQINVNHDPPTGLHEPLRSHYRIMRTPPGPEAVAVLLNVGSSRLQHLQQGLLNQPIRHRRYARLALAPVRFWDHYPPYRTGPVRSPQQLVSYLRPSRDQMAGGLLNIQSIHAGCSPVGFDAFHACRRFSLLRAACSSAEPVLSVSCRGHLASSLAGSRPASPCPSPARPAPAGI